MAQQCSGNDSPNDLIDERRAVAVQDRQVDGLLQFARQLLHERMDIEHDAAAQSGCHAGDLGSQPIPTPRRARGHQALVVERIEDATHRRARHTQPLADLGLVESAGMRLQQPQHLSSTGDDLNPTAPHLF